MEEVDEELVRATAALARLDLDPVEVRRLTGEFARIVAAFGKLAEVELAGEDEASAGPGSGREPRTRSGEPERDADAPGLVANAPAHEDGFFRVPKTLPEAGE